MNTISVTVVLQPDEWETLTRLVAAHQRTWPRDTATDESVLLFLLHQELWRERQQWLNLLQPTGGTP